MSIDPATITALSSAQGRQGQPVQVTIVSAPNNTIAQGRIQGDVSQVRANGEAVIDTRQGQVVVKTDPPLTQGQRVNIQLPQQLPQQIINAQLSATLTVLSQNQTPAQTNTVLPPPLLLDLPDTPTQTNTSQTPLPLNTNLYAAPKIGTQTVQTIFQLVGLNLPASLQTQTAPLPPIPLAGASGGNALPTLNIASNTLQNLASVQINVAEAGTKAQSFFQNQSVQLINANGASTPLSNAVPTNLGQGTTNLAQGSAAQTTNISVPALAKLVGFTPQKLPVFEITQLSPQITAPVSDKAIQKALSSLNVGDRVIIHQGISSPNATSSSGASTNFALSIQLPVGSGVSGPASAIPQNLYPIMQQNAPLLMQLLETPEDVVPPALLSQTSQIIPQAGNQQFPTSLIMTILGFAKSDPTALLGKRVMEALSDVQKSALRGEMQSLLGLSRDGASSLPEGTRIQFPVDMNGQFFIWALSYRSPYEDGMHSRSDLDKIEKPTRFVLDFTMSRLGDLQMDGLSFYKSRRLDLIMRTEQNLQSSVTDMLQTETIKVFEKTDMTGSIEFRTF